MPKQTAVEWLIEQLKHYCINLSDEFIEKAKSREKEQIEKAYIEGAEIAKEVLKEELKEVFVFPKSIFNENNK